MIDVLKDQASKEELWQALLHELVYGHLLLPGSSTAAKDHVCVVLKTSVRLNRDQM